MKLFHVTLVSLGLAAPLAVKARTGASPVVGVSALTPYDVRSVSSALDRYTQRGLLSNIWKRPGPSARDRSIVTRRL
jgi:4-carboxymuconolactone decarboxylase